MEESTIEIYKKLSDLYRSGTPIHNLIIKAKEMLGVKEEEVIQLIGEEPVEGGIFREDAIGKLVGIKSGVIIFSSMKGWKNSAGMLEKKDGDKFCVKLFFLYLGNQTIIRKPQKNDPQYPFYIYNKENYWGIEKNRWEKMKIWLDKFLP